MATIVYFEEGDGKCAIRFVKSVRPRTFWRRSKIEYTYDILDAKEFLETELVLIDFAYQKISEDFPDARISDKEMGVFLELYSERQFWAVCRWDEGKVDFFSGIENGRTTYTTDINDARLILSESVAKETLRTIQQTARERVHYRTLYLNLVNLLLTHCMMITCTNRRNNKTMYFKKIDDGNRLRMVTTSNAAAKFTYEQSLAVFEQLKASNKNHLYAVLPVFKDNVGCKDIERYMQDNNVSRRVAMDFKLKMFK